MRIMVQTFFSVKLCELCASVLNIFFQHRDTGDTEWHRGLILLIPEIW